MDILIYRYIDILIYRYTDIPIYQSYSYTRYNGIYAPAGWGVLIWAVRCRLQDGCLSDKRPNKSP